jgi:4'-phosphopantetheinyl transferase
VDVVWARPGDVVRSAGGAGGTGGTAGTGGTRGTGSAVGASGAAESLLDDVELSRLAKLRRPADRDRFVAVHALLRVAVGRFSGVDPAAVVVTSTCPVCGAPHGRPVITLNGQSAPAPYASLSHSGDRVVVAVTRAGPVGVDVEPLADGAFTDDAMDDIALTPQERAGVAALPPDARPAARARLWVRKEALLKATGEGLQVPPSEVEVAGVAPSERLRGARFTDLDLGDGYAGCVAVLSARRPSVEVSRWSPPAGHPFASDFSGNPGSSGS